MSSTICGSCSLSRSSPSRFSYPEPLSPFLSSVRWSSALAPHPRSTLPGACPVDRRVRLTRVNGAWVHNRARYTGSALPYPAPPCSAPSPALLCPSPPGPPPQTRRNPDPPPQIHPAPPASDPHPRPPVLRPSPARRSVPRPRGARLRPVRVLIL